MKKYFGLILITLLSIGALNAQTRDTRDLDDFTGIGFGVAGTLVLQQGNNFSVVLEGDEDYLEEIATTVKNDKLIISHDRWMSFGNKKVTIYVTMPEIEELNVSGSGNIIAEKSIRAEELGLAVSGSGNIKMDNLNAESIECRISGSGSLELDGSAEECGLTISGSGKYRGEGFRLKTMDVSISGSGTCRTMVEEDLEARVSGSGDIYYSGSPNVDARVSGSGKIRKN